MGALVIVGEPFVVPKGDGEFDFARRMEVL